MSRYEDMFHLERPASARPKMPRQERAKIFAPFAALSGLGAVVHERDRVLVPAVIQTEYSQGLLDEKLRRLRKGETATVIYFIPLRENGGEILGEYGTVTDTVEKVDADRKVLILADKEIPFADIAELRTNSEMEDCAGGSNTV